MQAVKKHYPDAELIDVELAEDPYLKPGHPVCHANGCGLQRSDLRAHVEDRI